MLCITIFAYEWRLYAMFGACEVVYVTVFLLLNVTEKVISAKCTLYNIIFIAYQCLLQSTLLENDLAQQNYIVVNYLIRYVF